MQAHLINDIFADIEHACGNKLSEMKIADICKDELYTTAKLSNHRQGIAMNYQKSGLEGALDHEALDRVKRHLRDFRDQVRRSDLLLDFFGKRTKNEALTQLARVVAILSALSQEYLSAEYLRKFGVTIYEGALPLNTVSHENDTITIVGFGGYLMDAIEDPNLQTIFISDLKFSLADMRPFTEKEIAKLPNLVDGKEIVFHGPERNPQSMKRSDIVCITGSALCNGTMDDLLVYAQDAREIIIQGHSSSLLPMAYFERGATHVVQPLIDVDVLSMTRYYCKCKKVGMQLPSFGDFLDDILSRKLTCKQLHKS